MRAGSVGLSVEAAREVLERQTFREAIDADWELSRQYGITGVRRSWRGATAWVGAQPYETLEALVSKAASEESS